MASTKAQSQKEMTSTDVQGSKAQNQQLGLNTQSQQQAPNNSKYQELADTVEGNDHKTKAGQSIVATSNSIKANKEVVQEEMAAAANAFSAAAFPPMRPRQPMRAGALYWKQ
ncbi:hypothetical protein E6O75_ATG03614 [Venturia nashicola]|uniref:Uncharacterized protein n=1 Tax=Venturia nashicola TaxID=86259 RepID=A0A4Z1PJ21_9PEZI|nr:hypothetical protein E6O75_ATG03614 [Venturia nashicola]